MQDYKFNCPSCGRVARIHEICHCDGVTSKINAFVDERHLLVGEPEPDPVWGCMHVDATGHGDVDSVTWQCAECGTEIDVECPEELVESGWVELLDHPPFPESMPPGWSATERGNNLLGRDKEYLAYYECGNGDGDDRTYLEVSICPENYPATSVRTFTQTPADLLAHCTNLVENKGWEWIKRNLE